MRKILAAFIFIIFAWEYALAETVIISNRKGPPDMLSRSDIEGIVFGKKKMWENGGKVRFVTMMKSPVHEEFIRQYTRKSAAEYKSYWKKMLFTGKGVPPKSFKTEADLLEYVANTEGAIAYVSAAPGNDNIKVIRISDQ